MSCPPEKTELKISNLKEKAKYHFRVCAETMIGASDHLQTENPVQIRLPYDPPGPPGVPNILKTAESSITIAYDKPETDGGSPIIGYIIEKSEITKRPSTKRSSSTPGSNRSWIKVNKTPVEELEYKCTGLMHKSEYVFRVSAVNLAGPGEPSDESERAFAREPICKWQYQ